MQTTHLTDRPKRGVRGRVCAFLIDPHTLQRVDERDIDNIFTDVGRNWLASLMGYTTFTQTPGVNEPSSSKRRYDGVRYMMVGTGTQLETNAVTSLVTPVPFNLAGDFLAQVVAPNTMPGTGISAVFERIYGVNEISMPSTVYISEVGLFPSGLESAPLDPAISSHAPLAYATFEPIPVSTAMLFGVRWEIKL